MDLHSGSHFARRKVRIAGCDHTDAMGSGQLLRDERVDQSASAAQGRVLVVEGEDSHGRAVRSRAAVKYQASASSGSSAAISTAIAARLCHESSCAKTA